MTHDPDHEHDEPDLPLADNPIWQQDNVTLHSVGIDIGSAGLRWRSRAWYCAGAGRI